MLLSEEEEEEMTIKEKILQQSLGPGPPSKPWTATQVPVDTSTEQTSSGVELESTPLLNYKNVLDKNLIRQLQSIGVNGLFPVQKETLERVMAGENIVVRSRTGSGKTLGFGIPIVQKLMEKHTSNRHRTPRCIILTPTRELCQQVCAELAKVAGPLQVAALYGGSSVNEQIKALTRTGVDIVVGTPGRVQDLIDRRILVLNQVEIAVLDEADEMLRMGFKEDVEAIFQETPAAKQSMLWSATMPHWVRTLAHRFLDKPQFIDLVGDDARRIPASVTLSAHIVQDEETRQAALLAVVRSRLMGEDGSAAGTPGGAVLVFADTKMEAGELAALRWPEGIKAMPLTGDIEQAQRERTLAAFKAGDVHVICATDVAARGLDISGVQLVVQYKVSSRDFSIESFTHRVGRTGRAGRKGEAVIFVKSRDLKAIMEIEDELGVPIHVRPLPVHDVNGPMGQAAIVDAATSSLAIPTSAAASDNNALKKSTQMLVQHYGTAERALRAVVLAMAVGDGDISPRGLLTAAKNRRTVLIDPSHPAVAALARARPLQAPKETKGISFTRYETDALAMLSQLFAATNLRSSLPGAAKAGSAPYSTLLSAAAANKTRLSTPMQGPHVVPEGIVLEMDAPSANTLIAAVNKAAGVSPEEEAGGTDAAGLGGVVELTEAPASLKRKLASRAAAFEHSREEYGSQRNGHRGGSRSDGLRGISSRHHAGSGHGGHGHGGQGGGGYGGSGGGYGGDREGQGGYRGGQGGGFSRGGDKARAYEGKRKW